MSHFRELFRYWRDLRYVNAVYRYHFGRRLKLWHPTRYTEKLHLFKISPEADKVSAYADKFAVREYVKQTIGEEYLIQLYGVYESVEEIDFDKLPKSFVLKATHGSGWNIICQDKSKLDWPETKRKLSDWLASNFYVLSSERQYNNIPPRLICEELLHEKIDGLTEYKIHCFGGKPYCIRAQAGRLGTMRKSFYDLEWNQMELNNLHIPPTPPAPVEKPKHLEKMLELATKLAKPFPYVRVDLYNINGKIYFSEITFTPNNGQDKLDPDFYDDLFGKMMDMSAWKRFMPKIP
jgi:hypothetical protein